MPLNLTKLNTKVLKLPGGMIQAVYDTGIVDAEDKPVLKHSATITQASIELRAGVLLPPARVKSILQSAFDEAQATLPSELAALG